MLRVKMQLVLKGFAMGFNLTTLSISVFTCCIGEERGNIGFKSIKYRKTELAPSLLGTKVFKFSLRT